MSGGLRRTWPVARIATFLPLIMIGVAQSTNPFSQASITISTDNVVKIYDGSDSAIGSANVTGGQLFSTDNLTGGTFSYTNVDAGSNKTVSVSSVTVNDDNAGGNYSASYSNNTTSTINTRPANLTGSRTYDGGVAQSSGQLQGLGAIAKFDPGYRRTAYPPDSHDQPHHEYLAGTAQRTVCCLAA